MKKKYMNKRNKTPKKCLCKSGSLSSIKKKSNFFTTPHIMVGLGGQIPKISPLMSVITPVREASPYTWDKVYLQKGKIFN